MKNAGVIQRGSHFGCNPNQLLCDSPNNSGEYIGERYGPHSKYFPVMLPM